MADQWPLRTFVELGALPGAAPCARLHARLVLWEWRLRDLSERAELIVSELVTNAVNASPSASGCYRSAFGFSPARPGCLCWCGTPTRTRPSWPTPPPTQERGRGLVLVEAVSEQLGFHFPRGIGGKVAWALCLRQAAVVRDHAARPPGCPL